jgi:hypothetical protein
MKHIAPIAATTLPVSIKTGFITAAQSMSGLAHTPIRNVGIKTINTPNAKLISAEYRLVSFCLANARKTPENSNGIERAISDRAVQ